MAYTVLARKYRSQGFDDVIGQDPIAQTLKNAIKTDRVAHAYLFTGTRGVGKTTMARILAKALNCLSSDKPTTEPCCKCISCIAVNLGEDIDVIEIDGASNNRVEEIRELRENAIYRPARSRYKIYIIDEVHMLTTSAFNALLKTLEEPPSHIKFIFATTEPNKVIPTIQSRCQRFDFRNISSTAIAEQLKSILSKENIKYQDELILPLAKMANGSMRDGLSLLDRLISTGIEPLTVELLEEFLGQPNSEKVWNLIEQIADSNAPGTLSATDDLIATGLSEVQIVDALIDYMRDLMVVKSAGTGSELLTLTELQRNRASQLTERFDIAGLIYNIATLERLRWAVKNSDTSRALLEASLLRFALSEHFLNVDDLLSRLKSGSTSATGTLADKKKVQNPLISTVTDKTRLMGRESHNIKSIKDSWQDILKTITAKLGPGTGGLLNSIKPVRFEDDVLTLQFGTSIHKEMFQRNDRAEQIRALLSEKLSMPIKKLEFEIASQEQKEPDEPSVATSPKTSRQIKNELLNNPAVKEVLLGLDATITGIEEKQT